MGVSGSGKSTVGRLLADALRWPFHDADDHHSAENVARMRRGEPLSDEDRGPWLDRLAQLLARLAAEGTSAVLACSALRERYRARLTRLLPAGTAVRFVYLKLDPAAAGERVAARSEHFMPAGLVASQFEALEEPVQAIAVDARLPPERIVQAVRAQLGL